jgi:hypothetical protein
MKTNEAHRKFIRSLPCLVCGDNTSVECAHIRYSDARIAKTETGMGTKPADCFTVPLCGLHHRKQHEGSERKFWIQGDCDPVLVSLALYAVSGDYEQGMAIVRAAHG